MRENCNKSNSKSKSRSGLLLFTRNECPAASDFEPEYAVDSIDLGQANKSGERLMQVSKFPAGNLSASRLAAASC